MSIINESHAIGIDTRNLVLKTRGTLHVKVGEQYYEIDFRNLKSDNTTEEKDDYILSINSKKDLEELEYPGDNKLIVGLDKSLFITKNGEYIEVTPEQKTQPGLSQIDNLVVTNTVRGYNTLSLDFSSSNITTDSLTVTKEINFPSTNIKNKCGKTYTTFNDDGDEYIVSRYQDLDFLELTMNPWELVVKSGVMLKSHINATIPVVISGFEDPVEFEFKKDGLYVIYDNYGEIVQTKLN
jgi:hypothetical protein